MRYFPKSVLTTPFCFCLDWVPHWELRTVHVLIIHIIPWVPGGGESATFSIFQKMYLKHGVNITTPPPPPLPLMDWMVVYSPAQERYLKQAKGPAKQELILIGEMWSIKKGILQLHPLPLPRLDGSPPPWMGEVLKTNQRDCTVKDYLDWRRMKHQGVSELAPSPLPYGMGC